MKHIIIGTAGHVDHGKTTLIQALTGTNPDRLKEEQLRGMTIDIGFASLRLPDGTVAGIIDVPGHERFLKNMLAGASGVDVVLLVIAADESVMPQTLEHLDILRLLDVRNGVVALTKVDMVDQEWIEAVEEDIRSHLEDTFLASAPIVRVSAPKGKGLDSLRRALQSAVSRAEARNISLPFRLPVDRAFTRSGFGTVVTGTLVSGTIRNGDAVEILPQKLTSRVRGLQVHGQKAQEAFAGSRVAVNLAGVEVQDVERGAQITSPGALLPTLTFDAVLKLLPGLSKPLKDRARIRLHIGTLEILGRARFLDTRSELEGGDRAYIQFRGETEFACVRGDRFVIRSYSPMKTIGGGIVLDPLAARHRKSDTKVLELLAAKERGSPQDLMESLLLISILGIKQKEAAQAVNLSVEIAAQALSGLIHEGIALLLSGDRIFHSVVLTTHSERARSILADYHEHFPLRAGMPKEELKAALGKQLDTNAFAALLSYWSEKRLLVVASTTVRLKEFQVTLNDRQQSLLDRIEAYYRECGIAVPTIEEVSHLVKAPPDAVNALLKFGVERGIFLRIADGSYYDLSTLEHLKSLIRREIEANGSVTVGAFRDLTNTNRKFALQALEYFDSVRFTRRLGDNRTLFSAD